MNILVISDIHANLTALEAVLADAGDVDAVWCLGDLVGYGPDPGECIARVKELPNLVCVIGNHDAAVLNQIDVVSFNPEARQAIEWTQKKLTTEEFDFLRNLPETLDTHTIFPKLERHVTLAHGSPRQPVWEYLLDTRNATRNFAYFETDYCFVGHTHMPVLYQMTNTNHNARLIIPQPNTKFSLRPRSIINPGSVGQPRDRDHRASYALYDPERHLWENRRIAYDVEDVQRRMQAAGLPERHMKRLTAGW